MGTLSDLALFLSGPELQTAFASRIFRGDSFQLVASDCKRALRAVLLLKATLLAETGIRVRVAIGLGPVNRLDPGSVEQSHGPAFELSGGLLDALPRYRHLALAVVDPARNRHLAALASLVDAVSRRWTAAQAEALMHWLRGANQGEVARALGVTQPAIQQRISGAGGFAISDALEYYESVVGSH
jgi:hypothetical protein